MKPIDIARVAHEVNRAYCQATGDFSHQEWQDAPEWQVDSALNGVALHLREPRTCPEASHDAWREEKRRNGWVYGPVKSEAAKTHPCMVRFHELPPEQQAKDLIFRAVVLALARYVPSAPVAHEKSPNQPIALHS
jgi:hypothetical protein